MSSVSAEYEVCFEKLKAGFRFCVYFHKRPDGSVFYVGKGLRERAYDLSPSRRSKWHNNIVAKYGRQNILVEVIPCAFESFALRLEKAHIKILRESGVELVNITDGGEGASGRKSNEKQLEALAKGRRVGKRGVCGPRPQLEAWIRSEAGQAHVKSMSDKTRGVERPKRYQCICEQCGADFGAANNTARFCGRNCQQRNSRAKAKHVGNLAA